MQRTSDRHIDSLDGLRGEALENPFLKLKSRFRYAYPGESTERPALHTADKVVFG